MENNVNIELSNSQFRELFISKIAYSYMTSFAEAMEEDGDIEGAYDRKEYLAQYADKFDCADMVELVGKDLLVREVVIQDIIMNHIHDFNDMSLPMTLSTAMAMRDLEHAAPGVTTADRPLTKKEEDKLAYYIEKYMKEFLAHCVDRLQIVK